MLIQLARLLRRLAQLAGLCGVTALGVQASLTQDAALRTLFALTVGVSLGCVISSLGQRAVTCGPVPLRSR